MLVFGKIKRDLGQSFNVLRRYRFRWVLLIALTWTALDLLLWAIRASVPQAAAYTDIEHTRDINYVAIRSSVVFGMSLKMGWLIVFRFRTLFRNKPLQVNLALKTLILMACSFVMNFF